MPRPMTDMDRRTFLKGAAGTSAALAVSAAYSRDLLAQETDYLRAGYRFLSPSEVPVIEALAEQIWPASGDTVGGLDAGVATYIDRALSGAYQEYQPVYRLGIEWVNEAANEEYGDNFDSLEADQQVAFLETYLGVPDVDMTATPGATPDADDPANLAVEGMQISGEGATPAAGVDAEELGDTIAGAPMLAGGGPPEIANVEDFLEIVLTHTIEGLFADPVYGGNRDLSVWRDLRYGGPYYVHTEEQQTQMDAPLDVPIQSIADL